MAQQAAVPLADGAWRIPTVPGPWLNTFVFAHADGTGVTLVDTGLPGAPARVLAGLASIGRRPADVRRIVVTHAHPDHAGGAAALAAATGAPVALHGDDVSFALAGAGPRPDPSTRGGRIMARLGKARFPPVAVDQELSDGEVLDGGLHVLASAGHTPGHVALLHEPSGVLVVGDALMNVGRMRVSPAALCVDARRCRESVRRLAAVDHSVLAFSHGPPIVDGTALAALPG
ncbi:MBL fold metallo-hydrolase [Pseudonocardia sp.]|jgi:glyoxylase-like metal-dependent hydrolase (beta-lactamase superfamily II)|uniref:MBL fold metallo-hydrolase n=1 Tax=Pseudonocardia sp. TaxID=60912 RepID=UPI003D09C405